MGFELNFPFEDDGEMDGEWKRLVMVTGCCLVFRIGSGSPGQRWNRNFARISFLDFRLGFRLLPLA